MIVRCILQARLHPIRRLEVAAAMPTRNSSTVATETASSQQPQHASEQGERTNQPLSQNPEQVLPLPEPKAGNATQLDVGSGQGVKLDHLGPMVVNRDGTLSRIANWEHMSDIERRNTLRILGKRNQLRMETLRAEDSKADA